MTPEEVVASHTTTNMPASHSSSPAPTAIPPKQPVTYPDGLTPREVEVLRLLADGLTNHQIAERLVVSLATVNTHVAAIFNKLGVNSRSAATRYAVERHLV